MNVFDFLAEHPGYAAQPDMIRRLNRRHAIVVEPYRAALRGARVLDLGAHDGRWSYAFALAGAGDVVGVEPRSEAIGGFAHFPQDAARDCVKLIEGEAVAALETFVEAGERFDVVAVLGIFYHIMEHFRLLWLIRQLGPRLVIVDGDFSLARAPVIELVRERTDKALNAVAQIGGQRRAIKGIPSFAAMDEMADALGFGVEWGDTAVFGEDRDGVRDYFRERQVRRAVCALRPR
jgi:hypothetical protein